MTMPRRRTFYGIGWSVSDADVFSPGQRPRRPLPRLRRMVPFPQMPPPGYVSGPRCAPPATTSRVWYRGVLCDALVAASQLSMIRDHFAEVLGEAGWPDGACLFLSTRQGPGKKVREDDSAVAEAIFFSPAAIAEVPHLIAVCGAVPSPPPDRESSLLLVGKQSDWDQLPRGTH